MDFLINLSLLLLVVAAVAPLLLLGLYVLTDYLGLRVAGRIIRLTVRLLALQWSVGGLVNIVAGLALSALGIWMAVEVHPLGARLLGGFLVPFGLWRARLGVGVLRAQADSAPPDTRATRRRGGAGR